MESAQDNVQLAKVPAWAQPFFDKMKAEMCAEVHAKVSYTVRIMLDQMTEDLKQSLKTQTTTDEVANSCYCRDRKKCHSCKTKRAAQRASQCILKKEERKQAKLAYSAYKESLKKHDRFSYLKSSESEEDNESEIPTNQLKLVKCSSKQVPIISLGALKPQSIAPKKPLEDYIILEQSTHNVSLTENEIPKKAEKVEVTCPQKKVVIFKEGKSSGNDLLKVVTATGQESAPPRTSKAGEANLSFSDSEFEVVAVPPSRLNPTDGVKKSETVAVAGDSDFYGTEEELESTTEGFYDFTDFQSVSEAGRSGDDAEEKMPKFMEDSVSSLCSSGDSAETVDVATEFQPSVILERQRTPYSASCDDVAEGGAIGGVVTNQPLPSEFERQRKAHSQSAAAMQPTRRNENYRVDNLPESLWEEALTVAAQTYNAAKVAVENLADTFVPGSSPPVSNGVPCTRNSTPKGPKGEGSGGDSSKVPTEEEQQLVEMGFTNTLLNSLLLSRHNNDMDKVVAALIDH